MNSLRFRIGPELSVVQEALAFDIIKNYILI